MTATLNPAAPATPPAATGNVVRSWRAAILPALIALASLVMAWRTAPGTSTIRISTNTDLFQIARDLGADCLATGHYVRRVEGAAGTAHLLVVRHRRRR